MSPIISAIVSAALVTAALPPVFAQTILPPTAATDATVAAAPNSMSASATRTLHEIVAARAALHTGDTLTAERHLRAALTLIRQEIDLPLASTSESVTRALALIEQAEFAAAEQALRRAEADIRFVSSGNGIPLAKAHRALRQAMEAYAGGHHAAVEAHLKSARSALKNVDTDADPKAREEARQLRAEMGELLAKEAHGNADAESDIGGFWHRAAALVEREAEVLYHSWRDQQTDNHFYRQLIEAKLHLFYAEHALFVSHAPDRARRELDRAAAYLQEAANMSPDRRTQVSTVRQEVTALAPLSDDPNPQLRQRYDAVLADLRSLIGEL